MSVDESLDYLPARMVNEVVYCPRLFFYEHVESVFVHNRETVEGSLRHAKLDCRQDALPASESLTADDRIHSRSVTLSSQQHGLIAKMDLIEGSGDCVTPVDYKRGAPRGAGRDAELQAWDSDRVQLGVQAIVLRENGYRCDEAVIFYVATRQRVRVCIDEELVRQTLDAVALARRIAARGRIPPPLEDSPKCPRCSLVGICLPDETRRLSHLDDRQPPQRTLFATYPRLDAEIPGESRGEDGIRRLVPARDDLRPLYLNSQGLRVGRSGNVLQVRLRDKLVQEVRIGETSQVSLMGNVQITTQAVQALCQEEVPIAYFSQGGWFYGLTQGLGLKNVFQRREQFRLADVKPFCLRLARALIAGKIRNQRTILMRNHVEPPKRALDLLKCYVDDARRAESLESLLGIEGNAARLYFQHFSGIIKTGDPAEPAESSPSLDFDFTCRNRRPPRDPVNALLSLTYSLLAKDLTVACQSVGLDPYLGFFHQLRFGRPSLALDLMEPMRPLLADSTVLTAINTRMITLSDFVCTGRAVALTPAGRKALFRAYEQRMDTLVTHPLFGYRVSYRRILEIQTRLLGRLLTGELSNYPVFVTR